MDISSSTTPRSDQQNFDDYVAGPKTLTIAEVRQGSAEQPVEIHLVEFPGRPYKPSKSMRRVLVAAWGAEASVYAGRRLTLYGDPEVTFGRDKVGGIKIAALSHIDKPLSIALTVTRGKRAPFKVEPLPDAAPVDVSKVDAALTAITNAATTQKLDEIAEYATRIGIHEHVNDAIEQRRAELTN
ncbi:hypothetical protein [Microbacterium oxydans]|uniref:hypothetical protein n=1 Tax=Microbacterium oxydans TaxID=82380 RepID=UPI0037CB4E16